MSIRIYVWQFLKMTLFYNMINGLDVSMDRLIPVNRVWYAPHVVSHHITIQRPWGVIFPSTCHNLVQNLRFSRINCPNYLRISNKFNFPKFLDCKSEITAIFQIDFAFIMPLQWIISTIGLYRADGLVHMKTFNSKLFLNSHGISFFFPYHSNHLVCIQVLS